MLPVRILGTDPTGRTFNEVGHTLDVNGAGVRLGKLTTGVKPGDELILQYRSNRGRFLVRWVGPPRSAVEGQVGLECLDSGRQMWPIAERASENREVQGNISAPPKPSAPGRTVERYECAGSVEVRASRGQKGFLAKVSDLSSDGCHVLTAAALPPDTPVVLLMRVGGVEVEVNGVVRGWVPERAMGIQFTQFSSAADRERLQRLLTELRAGTAQSATSGTL